MNDQNKTSWVPVFAGFVSEYLCLVPQDRKFVSGATGDIICQSSRWIPDFSLVRAATAFRAVEQYAANLINQPWRHEFWSIKQYSGFYKHNVQSSLSGAEKLFFDMGYRSGCLFGRFYKLDLDCILPIVHCSHFTSFPNF